MFGTSYFEKKKKRNINLIKRGIMQTIKKNKFEEKTNKNAWHIIPIFFTDTWKYTYIKPSIITRKET